MAFVRGTHDALAGGGAGGEWGAGRSFQPWRRSAVAFLLDLGLLGGAHASVAARVAAEAAALDASIRRVQKAGVGAAAAAAARQGVPASHWWFS